MRASHRSQFALIAGLALLIVFWIIAHSRRLLFEPLVVRHQGSATSIQKSTSKLSDDVDLDQRPPLFKSALVDGTPINCARLFEPQEAAAYAARGRRTFIDPPSFDDLPVDCISIHSRNYFQLQPLYDDESDFPLAFVRLVYRDYQLIEAELAASYAPQNVYCFALDSKTSSTFAARMTALAACLPNVLIAPRRWAMNSAGHNVTRSALECLRLLVGDGKEAGRNLNRPLPNWRFALLLQNHDISLKTNEELIRIFRWLNGTNMVSALRVPIGRVRPEVNWSFAGLRLFKNHSRNIAAHAEQPPILKLVKSLFEVALSRPAADFMMSQLDLTRLLDALDWSQAYGTDEALFSTLNANDAVQMPGGFSLSCMQRGILVDTFMRLSFWSTETSKCKSRMFRHGMCVFGAEDLNPNLVNSPYLFANKMMPDRDWAAIECWHELLFNRTHIKRGTYRLDRDRYLQSPMARLNRDRYRLGATFNVSAFECAAQS